MQSERTNWVLAGLVVALSAAIIVLSFRVASIKKLETVVQGHNKYLGDVEAVYGKNVEVFRKLGKNEPKISKIIEYAEKKRWIE